MGVLLSMILFAGVQWSTGGEQATGSIYTMRPDGTQVHRVTGRGAWTDTNPAWSPDRRRIAFGRYDPRGWRIYVMSASGRNLHAVTSRRSLAEAPTWSADGRSLAFAGLPAKLPATGSTSQQIYIVSLASGHVRRLTNLAAGAGTPAWSPGGGRIAFVAWSSLSDNQRADVWLIRPDGHGVRRLVRNADAPAWSPDGKRIAFARDGDIYVVPAAGGAVRRITRTPRSGDGDPSWCGDGRIVFASTRRAANPAKDDRFISTVRADGTGLRTYRDGDPSFWADAPAC